MISSFDYYRKLEEEQWGLIADRLEGASELTVSKSMAIRAGSHEYEMLNNANIGLGMFKQFARLAEGAVMNMGAGVKFVHQIPGHIFCYSVGSFSELYEYMAVAAERKYEAVLKIKSVSGLAQHIFDTGAIVDDGRRISDVFNAIYYDHVQYVDRSRDITEGPVIPPYPFHKAKLFEKQSEARMFFDPKSDVTLGDRLIVKIADAGAFFELVDR
jgi:hypothetical protein